MSQRIEVRLDDLDEIDEVLLFDGEACLFHMERLDYDRVWFALYPDGLYGEASQDFDIVRRKKRVVVLGR